MIGAVKPHSRSCPVVLDPTVAASFVALIGRGLAASAVQRGRSPFAEQIGAEVANPALALHDDGLDPEGFASAPFDAEGVPRRRTALIEGKHPPHLPLRHLHGQPRRCRLDRQRQPRQLPHPALGLGLEPDRRAGRAGLRRAPGRGRGRRLVTDVAGLHSGVNPVTGVFSVGASGRAIRDGEPAEPLREFTIAGDLVSMLRGVRAVGADSRWVPFGGSVSTPRCSSRR